MHIHFIKVWPNKQLLRYFMLFAIPVYSYARLRGKKEQARAGCGHPIHTCDDEARWLGRRPSVTSPGRALWDEWLGPRPHASGKL